ncbi:MAG: VWA domain-containing protein [Planctomycetes bacterium]|nr:VWA domain-containing protein [Planctomycetota bacterium]
MNALLRLALFAQDAAAPVTSAAEQRLKLWGEYALGDPWFLLAIPIGLLFLWWGRSSHGRDKGRVPVLPDAARTEARAHGSATLLVPALVALATALLVRFAGVPAFAPQDPAAGGEANAEARAALGAAFTIADAAVVLAGALLATLVVVSFVKQPKSRAPQGPPFPRSWAQRLAFVVPALQVAALACVAIALARPLSGSVESSSTSEGVDIALVIDRSGSMAYEDLEQGKSRLAVVKEVVEQFAARRMTDREGAADNCALITFAGFSQLLCPFTLDVDALRGFIKRLEPVKERHEDGTGIGLGLMKAVDVLQKTDARSKVVVLLTDGENNIDLITPCDAARAAAEKGVKVYTVFAGRYVYQQDFFGNLRPTEREIDTSDLQFIAKTTGGHFFRARDKAELEHTYAEIERLERTRRVERHWSETYDLYPWFLVPAIALYALAWLLGSTLLRRIA